MSTNTQYDWDEFDVGAYYNQYKKDSVIWEDRCLGRATIHSLLELGVQLKSLKNGIDVCNGGVLRGPSIIAPFIRDDGVVYWSDYGEPQIQHAKEIIGKGLQGNLEAWLIHQVHFGECYNAWSGASLRACQLGRVIKQSIFDLPQDTYDIGITCFGPESLTQDRVEWGRASLSFFNSVKHGQPVVMQYMVNSNGYDSAGGDYPAVPIDEHDVRKLASQELTDLQLFFVEASHEARPEDSKYNYEGMGVVIGRRK